jgi:predicted RNase H-like HicB family nuclease
MRAAANLANRHAGASFARRGSLISFRSGHVDAPREHRITSVVPAKPSAAPRQAEMNRYLIIIEETSTGYSAYSPDVPGCVATGRTRPGVENDVHDAIEFHNEGLRQEGLPIPKPSSTAQYVEVGVA